MRGEQEDRESPAGGRRGPAPAASELTPSGGDPANASGGGPSALGAPKQRESRQPHQGERHRFDHREAGVAIELRGHDLGRHHAEAAAEDVGRAEGGERRHEGQERRPRQGGNEQRQRDGPKHPPATRAETRRGFEERSVEARETRPREHVEVDVHGVRMHEQDGPGPRQPPGRFREAQQGLHAAGSEPALAVEKEEGDDADEGRQGDRQRDERSEEAAAGKLAALEHEGERNADGGRETHRGERDPEARPESRPLRGAAGELEDVSEGPVRRTEGLGRRQDERIADQPEEQKRQQRGRESASPDGQGSLGKTRGRGPSGAGPTRTRSPTRAASGSASTSISPASV